MSLIVTHITLFFPFSFAASKMSYYKYMVSVYRSQMPLMHSNMRSSSVERTYSSDISSSSLNRFQRSSTAPPSASDYEASYYGVMPFNRSLREIEDRINLRAASMAPATTYSRAYRASSPYGATTSYDYKVCSHFGQKNDNLNSDYP